MPLNLDNPPKFVVDDVAAMAGVLDAAVPPKRLDHNLLIATWNIREFGGLTEAWRAPTSAQPKRDCRSLACITEIVSRFDVVAVQEVQGDLKALRHMLKLLGEHWSFVLTDVTKGAAGGNERIAFVFDTRRVRMSGLACELVVPPEQQKALKQFARTPYAVSFRSAGRGYNRTFILVTLHVVYGKKPGDRTPELEGIASWVRDMALDVNGYDHNLIVLGDFNIDRKGDPNYEAFVSTGLEVPAELQAVPRTISSDDPAKNHYDQIAWFTGADNTPALSLRYSGKGGSVDFVGTVLRDVPTTTELSFKISDHRPLWAEFLVQG